MNVVICHGATVAKFGRSFCADGQGAAREQRRGGNGFEWFMEVSSETQAVWSAFPPKKFMSRA
jgi:hypothetical protein